MSADVIMTDSPMTNCTWSSQTIIPSPLVQKPEPLICKKMTLIMADIKAIGKEGKNVKQGYGYRRVDDVYAGIQPIMAKHGVFMRQEIRSDRTEERKTSSGSTLIYRIMHIRFYFVAEDGSMVSTEAIGEGMDSGDKASNKAESVAQKYAICQTFLIPTDDPKDPEVDSHEVQPKEEVRLYDNKNPKHKEWLQNVLEKQEVPDSAWAVVAAKLMGKDMRTVPKVIKEVMEGLKNG